MCTAKRFFLFLVYSFITILQPSATAAQNLVAALTDVGRGAARPVKLYPRELADFTDEFFRERMEKRRIPGAAIAVVKDGQIFLKRGYGYARVRREAAVDPDRTLFRVGSVSKVVTVMAVLQLAEQGRLNLSDDVNLHLKRFKIKNNFSNPLTIANLLTHTSGLDHQQIGRYARRVEDIQNLGDYLEARAPQLIFNPGESISYSNYGISLAGFLVEEITGQSFFDYVNENIFHPLKMEHTAFFHPNKEDSDLALGFKFENGSYQPFEPEYLNLAPAGGLLSSAGDMAHLLIACLHGRNGMPTILKSETLAEMQRRHFTLHPEMPGWCYGFYEEFRNHLRAVMHTGRMRGYSSLFYLVPEEKLGIFIVYNTNETKLYEEYLEVFFNRYYPFRQNETRTKLSNGWYVEEDFSGTYMFHSFPERTLAKYASLFDRDSQVKVTALANGALKLHLPNREIAAAPVGSGLYKMLDENRLVAFKTGTNGEATQMYLTEDKPATLKKVAWWQTLSFQLNLRRAFGWFFALALLLLSWSYVRAPKNAGRFLLLANIICALNLAFLIGLHFLFDPSELRFGVPNALAALLVIPIVTTILSAALPITITLLLRNKLGSLWQRLSCTAVAIAAFAFIAFLDYWNLLGFRF
jgi:CubicO group peptidase (beta-lactamase class C family)